MFGISGYQFLLLMVLAFFLIGPERLPQYARTLADWVRRARGMAEGAKVRFREETGTDFDAVDWQKYDPRQYDPRRIIRDALSEEYDAVNEVRSSARLESPRSAGSAPRSSSRGGSASGGAGSRAGARAGSAAGSVARNGSAAGARAASRPGPSRSASTRTGASQAASRAGVAGAAERSSQGMDPREVFGTPAASVPTASEGTSTAEGPSDAALPAGSALAAGVAGAAAAEAETAQQPAPFDVDAT